jgi:hypothetical protein
MKRKGETQQRQNDNNRRDSEPSSRSPQTSSTPDAQTRHSFSPSSSQQKDPQRTENYMDIDNHGEDMENHNRSAIVFGKATPSDMYGIQSDLIGRRSFGGFNASMEEAWKDSKDFLETGRIERSKQSQHITDEELLQRYQDVAQNRNNTEGDRRKATNKRAIGNLNGKMKKPKQQHHNRS